MFFRIIALAATAAIAAPASAQAAEESAPRMLVRHGDLDLTRAAGVKALASRIARAADMVCQPAASDLKARTAASQCRARARAHAAAQMQLAVLRARSEVDLAANSAALSSAR